MGPKGGVGGQICLFNNALGRAVKLNLCNKWNWYYILTFRLLMWRVHDLWQRQLSRSHGRITQVLLVVPWKHRSRECVVKMQPLMLNSLPPPFTRKGSRTWNLYFNNYGSNSNGISNLKYSMPLLDQGHYPWHRRPKRHHFLGEKSSKI
jgi:hypothetical protein